jgi:hypothetical protein
MARRTRRFIVLFYALPAVCALACVMAGGPKLSLLLLAAPAVGVIAARWMRVGPAQAWAAPRRRRKRSTLRRWQFRLRSILALVTAAAVLFGLLTWGAGGALAVVCVCAMLAGIALDRFLGAVIFERTAKASDDLPTEHAWAARR